MPDAEETTQTPPQGDPAPSTPPSNPPPTDPTPPPGDPQEPSDVEGYKKALAAVRAEAAIASRDAKARAKELEAVQAKIKAAEDAEKTDLQRASEAHASEKARADALETRMREQAVRHAVSSAARDANFIDPDIAFRLIESSFDFDDSGEPQGVDEAVKALAKERPYLVKPAGREGPPPTERSGRDAGTLSAEEAREQAAAYRRHERARF